VTSESYPDKELRTSRNGRTIIFLYPQGQQKRLMKY
jgi:hypothetical protein